MFLCSFYICFIIIMSLFRFGCCFFTILARDKYKYKRFTQGSSRVVSERVISDGVKDLI